MRGNDLAADEVDIVVVATRVFRRHRVRGEKRRMHIDSDAGGERARRLEHLALAVDIETVAGFYLDRRHAFCRKRREARTALRNETIDGRRARGAKDNPSWVAPRRARVAKNNPARVAPRRARVAKDNPPWVAPRPACVATVAPRSTRVATDNPAPVAHRCARVANNDPPWVAPRPACGERVPRSGG